MVVSAAYASDDPRMEMKKATTDALHFFSPVPSTTGGPYRSAENPIGIRPLRRALRSAGWAGGAPRPPCIAAGADNVRTCVRAEGPGTRRRDDPPRRPRLLLCLGRAA